MSEQQQPLEVLTRLELYFSIRHLNRTMRIFGQVFDHDYEMVAIFLTVAEVCLQAIFHLVALDPERTNIEQLYSNINEVGMTALSIGEQTGVPRETVRRKLKILIDRGYLAVSPKSKNIYLPSSTIASARFIEIFGVHVRDVAQLVRTVTYYQKDPL